MCDSSTGREHDLRTIANRSLDGALTNLLFVTELVIEIFELPVTQQVGAVLETAFMTLLESLNVLRPAIQNYLRDLEVINGHTPMENLPALYQEASNIYHQVRAIAQHLNMNQINNARQILALLVPVED